MVEPSSDVPNVVPLEVPPDPVVPIEGVKKKPKGRYTGERMAPARAYAIRALVDSGFPKPEICRREHISKNTLKAIETSDKFDPQRIDRIKSSLSAHFYDTAHRSLEGVTPEKIEKASGLQLVTMAAISTDKARLIEGKATSRTEYLSVEDMALNTEIQRLEGELGQWKDGSIVNGGIEGPDTTPIGVQAPETVDKGSNEGV